MNDIEIRREEEKNQRRESILAESRKLFANQGLEHTTMNQIANATRLSRALIYFYFQDRDHIYISVVEKALQNMLSIFKTAAQTKESGIDKVTAIGESYIDFAVSNPDYFSAVLRFQTYPLKNLTQQDDKNKKKGETLHSISSISDKINKTIAEQISIGISDNTISNSITNPIETALFLWSTTSGLIQTFESKGETFQSNYQISRDQFYHHGISMLKKSLSPG
jgi:AcrR family transcriptional regulator